MKKFKGIILMILGLLCLTACSSQQQTDNKTLKVGTTQFTSGINPAVDWNGWYTVRFGIGETLFKMNDESALEPWLVSSYQQLQDNEWEFELKPNITFSNGEAVTAQSVVESLQKVGEQNVTATTFKTAQYQVKDDQHFTITTSEASPTLINELADPRTAIVDVDHTDGDKVVATGPYVVDQFSPNVSISLKPNTHYWNGTPKLDGVEYTYIPDGKTLALSLVANDINAAVDVPDDVMDTFKNKNLTVLDTDSSRIYHIDFNTHKLTDQRLRQALMCAINKDEIANDLLGGNITATNSAFPAYTKYNGEKLTGNTYDPNQTQTLMTELGYQKNSDGYYEKDGKVLTIQMMTYKRLSLEKVLTQIQSQLKAVGIQSNITVAEKADTLFEGNYDLALASAVTFPTGDPYYFLQATLSEEGSLNYAKTKDDRIETLLKTLHPLGTSDASVDVVNQIQQEAIDQALVDYIGFIKLHKVVNPNVKNFDHNPSDYYQINVNTTIE